MSERINKLYKPAELVAAQRALVDSAGITNDEASSTLIALHKLGFRVVYVGKTDK